VDKRRLGQSDLHLAPLMLGGNVFGWNVDEPTSFEILDAFVDAGFNAIDTSDSYSRWVPGHPGGESETIIGNWLKKSGKRDKVLIATKVGEDMGEGRSLRKEYILRECEASLRRLQTDYIDLYQTHFDDEVTPPEETMQAYAILVAAGKVRAIGASNMTPARLKASLAASSEVGAPRYESLQPLYNLSDRRGIRDRIRADLPAGEARRHQLLLARGRLPHRQVSLGRGRRQASRTRRAAQALPRRSRHADPEGARHRGRAPQRPSAQVAIAWLIAKPIITAPIASATSRKQLEEIIKAPDIKLSREDIAALDAGN
jgi:aryl-alcohol dehydrogenase-like predicted oxidoreductase